MVLLISENDVRKALTMKECIGSLESCLVEQSNGRVVAPVRTTVDLGFGKSKFNPSRPGFIRLLPGSLNKSGYLGVKMYVDVSPEWTDKIVLCLYSSDSGKFLSLMSADFLSDTRTGAMGGVAVKYLSNSGSSILSIFGTGRQAYTQLEAVLAVRNIRFVKVMSRSEVHAKDFVTEMRKKYTIEFQVCRSSLEMIEGSDIIITATTSKDPLFEGKLVNSGTHVNAIGASFPSAREVDGYLIRKAKIFVNLKDQAMQENGEFIIPLKNREIESVDIYGELCDVVAGKLLGRANKEEITLFKFNGSALWDIAAASLVYQKALRLGLGKEFEL